MAKQIIVNYIFGAANQEVLEFDTDKRTAHKHMVPLDGLADFIVSQNPDSVNLVGAPTFFHKYKEEIENKSLTQYNKTIDVKLGE